MYKLVLKYIYVDLKSQKKKLLIPEFTPNTTNLPTITFFFK